MATKQIIVLNQITSETEVTYLCLFWFPITKNPITVSNGSLWVPVAGQSTGPSGAETTAIQNGSIKEEQYSHSFPVNTPVAAIESVLQTAWTNRNNELQGQGGNQFYGSWFDGTTWGAN